MEMCMYIFCQKNLRTRNIIFWYREHTHPGTELNFLILFDFILETNTTLLVSLSLFCMIQGFFGSNKHSLSDLYPSRICLVFASFRTYFRYFGIRFRFHKNIKTNMATLSSVHIPYPLRFHPTYTGWARLKMWTQLFEKWYLFSEQFSSNSFLTLDAVTSGRGRPPRLGNAVGHVERRETNHSRSGQATFTTVSACPATTRGVSVSMSIRCWKYVDFFSVRCILCTDFTVVVVRRQCTDRDACTSSRWAGPLLFGYFVIL
jgi:hypothetical protein